MSKKQKAKPNLVWIKRRVKDSQYENHWEYKLIDKKNISGYSRNRWSKGVWQIHSKVETAGSPVTKPLGTMRIDQSKIVVAKANVKIV